MIIYHPAFDLYHTVYRMLQLLIHLKSYETIEVERLRIWDFYMLFPEKISTIKLKREEKDIKDLIRTFIPPKNNPYEKVYDNRKMFEKIKPYQMAALKSLASYGIINKDYLVNNHISPLANLSENQFLCIGELSSREKNAMALLTSHFYQMSLFGANGLKDRSGLMEYKYDVQ
ncbi:MULTISPECIES: ABC-three component system middle component 5 [Bacteroides]|mgnify:CR=1 FL=1|uniref:ABC-three component system middle component 5 n=1 Tax=Bacteroides TaxID=816 RepID=UPI00242E17E1|nr:MULTISPECIES: ABC-three component system middle component 5 [Bacteroides]